MTETEYKVYREIVQYYEKNTYLPTVRELQERFNYKSTNSIYRIIVSLEKKGYLSRENTKRKRTLTTTTDLYGNRYMKLEKINHHDSITINEKGLNLKKEYTSYKINNNYFNSIFIRKNDYLIIEKTSKLKNNDLGLFIICDKYRIMKYFYKDGFYVLTDNKQVIVYNVKIVGKVIGIYRDVV